MKIEKYLMQMKGQKYCTDMLLKMPLKKTYTPKGVLFGSVEISTKLCPGVNV